MGVFTCARSSRSIEFRFVRLKLLLAAIIFIFLLTYVLLNQLSSGDVTGDELPTYAKHEKICKNRNQTKVNSEWPKVIHQIWAEGRVPQEYLKLGESCKRKNPDYHFKLWTAYDMRELLVKQDPWFVETYDSYRYPIDTTHRRCPCVYSVPLWWCIFGHGHGVQGSHVCPIQEYTIAST